MQVSFTEPKSVMHAMLTNVLSVSLILLGMISVKLPLALQV